MLIIIDYFIPSDNDEYSVIIHPDASKDSIPVYIFVGKILAKAVLENLTVGFCFNKIIYLLFLGRNVTFDNLVFIDKGVSISIIMIIVI